MSPHTRQQGAVAKIARNGKKALGQSAKYALEVATIRSKFIYFFRATTRIKSPRLRSDSKRDSSGNRKNASLSRCITGSGLNIQIWLQSHNNTSQSKLLSHAAKFFEDTLSTP